MGASRLQLRLANVIILIPESISATRSRQELSAGKVCARPLAQPKVGLVKKNIGVISDLNFIRTKRSRNNTYLQSHENAKMNKQ